MTIKTKTEDIIVGREHAEIDPPAKPENTGTGGHPLPASEKARHGSIPESVERRKGHGSN